MHERSRCIRSWEWGVFVVACLLQASNFLVLHEVKRVRDGYRQSYTTYHDKPCVHVVSHDIRYIPREKGYSAWSKMTLRNETPGGMKQVLLFLNPSLQITRLGSEGQPVMYTRENQVVLVIIRWGRERK